MGVTYSSGRLVANIQAVVVFVKSAADDWVDLYQVPGTPVPVSVVCQTAGLVSDLVDSAFMDAIGLAYSVPSLKIGRGTFGGVFYLDVAPAPVSYHLGPADILDADVRQAITDSIALGTLPMPNQNTVYIVIAPGEVKWWEGVTGTSAGGGAYHSQIPLSAAQAVPYCMIGSGALGSAAITHEMVEAITNSDLYGWADRTQNPAQEVADLCFPRTVQFHGNDVSKFYSPVSGSCVGPADDSLLKPAMKARIAGGVSYCEGGIVAGERFQVSAEATYLGAAEAAAQYSWSSQDVQIDNPLSATPTIDAPAAPGPFTLEVLVIGVHGCYARATRAFTAVSRQESDWYRALCQIVKDLPRRAPIHVDPLWDPLRDLTTHPLSREEVGEIRAHVQHMNRLVEHFDSEVSPQRTRQV